MVQGFLTWGAITLRGCWNQYEGVLGKVTYVVAKGKRNTLGQTYCQCYCHNCCFCFGECTKHMIKMYCTCLYSVLIVTRC